MNAVIIEPKDVKDEILSKYFFGGLNKRRPNRKDYRKATGFATMISKLILNKLSIRLISSTSRIRRI